MPTTSRVTIGINFSGSIEYGQEFEGPVPNTSSPADIDIMTLSSGANTITVPSGATGVTLIPPDDNAVVITLKGVSGDTGIVIDPVDPMHLSLSAVSSFVLNAASSVTGFRLIWS